MPELTIGDKLRSGHVSRWQIVNVGRRQSVAEHSFLVQLLAVEISRLIGYSNNRGGPFNNEREYHIMRWAMWHDLLEVKTGDINTPMKKMVKAAVGDGVDVFSRIEFSMSGEYAVVHGETHDTVKDIVKLADYMEALGFLSEEGKGPHAQGVRHDLYEQAVSYLDEAEKRYRTLGWKNLRPMLEGLCPEN